MKLSTATVAIAVSAALASASPLPLRIVVVSSTNVNTGMDLPKPEPFINMRLGHAVPNPDVARLHASTVVPAFPGAPAAPHHFPALMHGGGMGMKKPCGGRGGRFRAKFNEKAVALANTFRKAFGLPLIDTQHNPHTHHHHGMHSRPVEVQIVPLHAGQGGSTIIKTDGGMKGAGWWGHTKGGDRVQIVSAGPGVGHGQGHHHHHERPVGVLEVEKPFTDRLMLALMSLGPWEGRFVAFVIGAGIGVLIRMVYVLCIVMFRSGKKDSEYEVVAADEDDEDEEDGQGRRRTPLSAPPEYVYPVDEKIVYAQEVQKAPAANTAEGPN